MNKKHVVEYLSLRREVSRLKRNKSITQTDKDYYAGMVTAFNVAIRDIGENNILEIIPIVKAKVSRELKQMEV